MTSPARRAHGPTVRALRTAQSRRLHDVAADAGVSVGFLSRVERGRETASAELTARLASTLGVPVPMLTGQTPAVAALARVLGVSPRDLAAAVGVSQARLTSIAEGVVGPTSQEVERLTVRLGVDADALGLSESAVA